MKLGITLLTLGAALFIYRVWKDVCEWDRLNDPPAGGYA